MVAGAGAAPDRRQVRVAKDCARLGVDRIKCGARNAKRSERRGPDEPKRAEALGPVTVHARVGPSLSCAGAQRQAVHTLHTHLRLGNSRVCAPSHPRADASRWAGRRWTPERHIAEHGHMHVAPASWGGAPSVYCSRTAPLLERGWSTTQSAIARRGWELQVGAEWLAGECGNPCSRNETQQRAEPEPGGRAGKRRRR